MSANRALALGLGLGICLGCPRARADETQLQAKAEQIAKRDGGEDWAKLNLPKMTYAEVLKRAVDNAPEVVSAEAELRRAEAEVVRTRSAWLPSLNGVLTYSRLDADRVVGDRIASPANAINLSALITVPIVMPASWYNTARGGDAARVKRAQIEDVKRRAVLAVSRAYLAVLLGQEGVDIAEHAVVLSQDQLSLAEARTGEGVGSRLEVVRAERELRTNRAGVRARRAELVEAQRALGVLTQTDGPVDALGQTEPKASPPLAEALDGLAGRADLLALERQAELDRDRAAHNYLDYLPTVAASGQIFYQNPPSVNFPETGWQMQVLLTVPIYQGGRRRADAETRRADASQSQAEYRRANIEARAEVTAISMQVRELEGAYDETRSSLELARESQSLARLAFEAGTGTQIELIEAQRNLKDAETNAALAQISWIGAKLVLGLLTNSPAEPSDAPPRRANPSATN